MIILKLVKEAQNIVKLYELRMHMNNKKWMTWTLADITHLKTGERFICVGLLNV
jgi:S-methylmethionine-dependent homocysteine/selenocysteine methylase